MEYKAGCSNPWCKAKFTFQSEIPLEEMDNIPTECPKCISFNTGGFSGGINWTDKQYAGDRNDGQPHQIKINVQREYKDSGKRW